MSLTLVLGRAVSAKSRHVHDKLRSAAERGEGSVLVVPTSADVDRAAEEMADSRPVGVRIMTMSQWFGSLWALHGDGRALVTNDVRAALVDEVGASSRDAFVRFPGTRRTLSRLAAEVADPEDLAAQGRLASELATVFSGYWKRLEESGLAEEAAAARILSANPPRLPGPVGLNRFTDLQEWQVSLLLALSAVNEVAVALTWDEDAPGTAAANGLVEQLTAVPHTIVVAEDSAGQDPEELRELERLLFTGAAGGFPPRCVQLGEATSGEAEAALVARVARERVDAGVAPERVAVAFRQLESRRELLEMAFDAAGLDVEIDALVPLDRTPLGATIATLVDAARGVGGRRDVLAAFGGPYGGPARDTSRIDERLRRAGVDDAFGTLAALSDSGTWARRTIDLARELVSGPLDEASGKKWQNLARRLAAAAADARGGGLAEREARQDASALAAFEHMVGDLVALPARVGAREVLAAMADTRVASGRYERPGAVTVTRIENLRSRRFDTVVIGGLTAGEFSPERMPSQRARFASRLGLPAGTDQALVERSLFYHAITRAANRLYLVRQVVDERGEAIRPSTFWDEVLQVYGVPSDTPPEGAGFTVLRLSAASADTMPATHAERSRIREAACAGGRALVRPTRGLRDVEPGALKKESYSTTELEAWLSCPYRWFYERVVRPARIDAEVDALELGSLLHDALARFYAAFTAAEPTRVSEDTLASALSLFDEIADELRRERDLEGVELADELAITRALSKARQVVIEDVVFLPGWTPTAFELDFGRDESFSLGGVGLHGRIDRIDVGPAGIVVIDYKSGAVQGRSWKVMRERGDLQLAVYAAAAEHVLDRRAIGSVYRSLAKPELAGFWDAACPPPAGLAGTSLVADDTQRAAVFETAAELVAEAAEGIARGDVAPKPRTPKACAFCALKEVCPDR